MLIYVSAEEPPERRPGGFGFRKFGKKAKVLCHVVEETSGSARSSGLSGCRGRGLGHVFTGFRKSVVDRSSAMVGGGACNNKELGNGTFAFGLDRLLCRIPEVGNVWLLQLINIQWACIGWTHDLDRHLRCRLREIRKLDIEDVRVDGGSSRRGLPHASRYSGNLLDLSCLKLLETLDQRSLVACAVFRG